MRAQLSTLGQMALVVDGRTVVIPRLAKSRMLLAYLALGGQPISRRECIERFWADERVGQPEANLSTTLSQIRSALKKAGLDPAQVLGTPDGQLHWCAQTAIDAQMLVEAAACEDAARLEAALESVHGEFLQGLEHEWIDAQRRRIADALETILRKLLTATSNPQYAERLVALDPTDERAYDALIRFEVSRNRPDAAAAVVLRAARALREIGPALAHSFEARYASLLGRASGRYALPFVGRDAALQRIRTSPNGAVIIVSGETGIGRSALLRQISLWNDSRFTTVDDAQAPYAIDPARVTVLAVRVQAADAVHRAIPYASEIRLEPLSIDDVRSALRSSIDGANGRFAALVHAASEGVPLSLAGVIDALIENGDIAQRDGRWTLVVPQVQAPALPAQVRRYFERRLRELPEVACTVAVLIALDAQARIPEIAAAGNLNADEAHAALDALYTAGIVHDSDDGLHFARSAWRQAAANLRPASTRREYHRALAAALSARSDEPARARRARHLEASEQFFEAAQLQLGPRTASVCLPEPITDFIGRRAVVQRIRDEVRICRLVTVTGPGGIGKTRASIEAARECAADFETVIFVDLAAISNPQMVVAVIAAATGSKERQGESLLASIVDALAGTRVLVLLDNCEHLIQSVADAAGSLLRSLPSLHILATSRVPIGIAGEASMPLDPLSGEEAEALFSRNNPSAAKSSATLVRAICGRLDNLPSAIELAAAASQSMPLESLLQTLDRRFDVLQHADASVHPHQRTLWSTIAWSYDRLEAGMARAFTRLSIFPAEFNTHDAQDVCEVDAPSVPLLARQSLVVALADGRYRMLESIREFARVQLQASPDQQLLNERFVLRFFQGASALKERYLSMETTLWTHEVAAGMTNYREALRIAFGDDSLHERGAALVAELSRYWYETGAYAEAEYWMTRALEFARGVLRTNLLHGLAAIYGAQENVKRFAAVVEEAYPLFEQYQPRSLARARNLLATAKMWQGDYAGARALFEENVRVYEERKDKLGYAISINNLATLAGECEGDFEQAERWSIESTELDREAGLTGNVAIGYGDQALLAYYRGDYPRASLFSRHSATLYSRLENRELVDEQLARRARYELLAGDPELCRTLLHDSAAGTLACDNVARLTWFLETAAMLAARCGRPEEAAQLLGAAQELRRVRKPICYPVQMKISEQIASEVRVAAGRAFDAALLRGTTLTPAEAVALSLNL